MNKKGFTLLEVLIAGSVLFMVGASVVSLTNSIIQGTIRTTEKTVMNRWATEGLELTKKIRDNNVLSEKNWLEQAVDPNSLTSSYGWHLLRFNQNRYSLIPFAQRRDSSKTLLEIVDSEGSNSSEVLTSNELTGFRLVCIESVSAVQKPLVNGGTDNETQTIYCNADENGNFITDDGSRENLTSCDDNDFYCSMTQPSLNKNRPSGKPEIIIPAGNAVRVRAVVAWQIKDQLYYTDIGSILTNWQWRGNVSN